MAHISEEMSELDALNFELRVRGQRALKKALTKLTKLTKAGAREGKDFESTDLEAAKALAKLGIEALKLAKTPGVRERLADDGQKDLFDVADPWKLKQTE